ncbi:MAG TPA: glycosyltransferase family 4 protein [Acidobacteriaceae bacterium]|nr:glycosyltransferase family 4 protein [Acidobacteriaceae bacterium]
MPRSVKHLKLLVFVTDAFGGRGGIAKFNRDLLRALSLHPRCDTVLALPRLVADATEPIPDGVAFHVESVGGKWRYVRESLRVISHGGYDAVLCGHINLLPVAALAAGRLKAPLVLVTHGIEAWSPSRLRLRRPLMRRVDKVVAVSEFTGRRVLRWSGIPESRLAVIPNCIDAAAYGPGEKSVRLLERYGITGRKVLLTVARLSAAERYKGIDEVLGIMPRLLEREPDLAYLVVGEGDDVPRLRQIAACAGISDRVVFTGYVPEEEKADHYRLADAFVMPGRGEGFGIVYLEALACGVPVVASSADASSEAVRNGLLGEAVSPDDPAALTRAVLGALNARRGMVPEGLDHFSVDRFQARWWSLIDNVMAGEERISRAADVTGTR